MATTDLNIVGGTPPYNVKITKYGETLDRAISFNGTTLEFDAERSKNTEIYYIVSVEDSSSPDVCSTSSSFFLWCPYDCGTLPTITDVSYICDEFAANLTFTYTSDTDVQISVGNVVNGDFYWQPHPAGTGTITTPIPKERASVIGVYKQNTEYTCKTLYTVNPDCNPGCTFTFDILNTFCPSAGADIGTIHISGASPNFTVEITEGISGSNLFNYRIGNILHFTPIQDGIEHSYLVTLSETDTNGTPTGCQFSRTFSLTCGTTETVCGDLDVVLCIDTSQSIRVNTSGMGSEWQVAQYKNGIKEILKKLKSGIDDGSVKVGVVTFSDSATIKTQLTGNYSSLVNIVDSLTFSGNTNMCSGLDNSNNILRGSLSRDCEKSIILITDGEPTAYCIPDPSVTNKTQTKNKATEIKTTPVVKGGNSYYIEILAIGLLLSSSQFSYLQTLTTDPSDAYNAPTFEEFSIVAKNLIEDLCS